MKLNVAVLVGLLFLSPGLSSAKPKDKMLTAMTKEIKKKCPACEYAVIQGRTIENEAVVDCTYILVLDGGDQIRAYRVKTDGGDIIVVYFPNKTLDVRLHKFLEKLLD